MQPDEKLKAYADAVGQQVRWKKIRPAVQREIEAHLYDQFSAYCADGMAEQEAAEKAVRQMGDAQSVGLQLDRVHRPKAQTGMLLLAGLLMLTGMAVSLLPAQPSGRFGTAASYFAAFGLMLVCYFADFTLLGRFARKISLGIAALAAFVVLTAKLRIMGRLVLPLGPWNLSLTLLASVFPLCLALFVYSMRGKGYAGILLCGGLSVLLAGLLVHIPSISGAVLFAAASLGMLCTAAARGWFGTEKKKSMRLVLFPAAAVCAAAASVLFLRGANVWSRLTGENDSFFSALVKRAVNGAALIGEGGTLTAQETQLLWKNMPLCFVMYRLGVAAAVLIVLLAAVFCILGLAKAMREKSMLAALTALSVILMLAMQAAVGISESFGVGMFTGTGIPFIGQGTAGLMLNAALTGFMLSVFRTGEALRENERILPE